MKPCEDCLYSRESPDYALHSLLCLHCGARLIQRIQKLRGLRPADEITARCRKVLADWMKFGHAETDLRRLASLPELALQPLAGGLASSSEPERQTTEKHRSRGRRPA